MRYSFGAAFFSACLLVQSAALAAPQSKMARDVESILARPSMHASQLGIAFYDLDAGRILYQRDAGKFFVAASTTKVLTESTSLALLGPDYRFTTAVYRSGTIDANGVLHGDVVLRASGDPNISGRIQRDGTLAFENEDHAYGGSPDTKAVPGDPLAVLRDLAKQIAAHGIKSVIGSVLVDDSLFPDATQELGTGTNVAPIAVNDNVIDVTVSAGAKPGDPVRVSVSPVTPYANFVSTAVTGAAHSANTINMPTDVEDASGSRSVTITGSFPLGSHPVLYAYPVPSARVFAQVAFAQALADAGVRIARSPDKAPVDPKVLAAAYTPANEIAAHQSPPLSEDVKITLKVSDNLHAAMMPYLWGALLAHDTTDPQAAGFKLENAFLKRAGFNPLDFVQNDGEGANAFFQPAQMVRFLAYVRQQPFYPYVFAGLPVLGVDGTLFNIQTHSPAAGKVHAKTGTNGTTDLLNANRLFLSGKGLLGYMTSRSGRHLAFCIYVNNFGAAPSQDVMQSAGQIAGEIASDGYVDL
ncbi:MAG TPA: D-alanyl-D-alanine carboxypeptidase/D-alanyl-D-alanine-endopeptidase [Candidatus Baltobacteraceae bacterium]|nr:D-alanyl-D-alanine carboxypeptidase/D-alanyl-D-alanine-endopeptidase [Candidatus Baltobacteraceae bacterium]